MKPNDHEKELWKSGKKIEAIRALRARTDCGLKEAKESLEGNLWKLPPDWRDALVINSAYPNRPSGVLVEYRTDIVERLLMGDEYRSVQGDLSVHYLSLYATPASLKRWNDQYYRQPKEA